jgi:hypothetical protein
MEVLVAISAVAGLVIIAISGWCSALRTKKRNGALEQQVTHLEGDRLARIAQDKTFDRDRGADMAGDRDFLPDTE